MASRGSTFTSPIPFGLLLRQLRKRAGMTQRDLAAALGYSDSLISSLEKGQRQPDPDTVRTLFIPALGLQDEPGTATQLITAAAFVRGQALPLSALAEPVSQTQKATVSAELVPGLPTLPVELIGRDEIIHQLGNRLRGQGGRLLTLLGPPGVGKTVLALAIAAYVQHHYRDGARFVPLAAVSDPMVMATTIIATIAPGDASNKPPQDRLIDRLRRQNLLLVLDNLEQLLSPALSSKASGVGLIATLLRECPALTILATSRERLHLRAEQRCKVPPLELNAAVELFVQRAQAVDEDFRLTEHNHSTLAAICTRLDCLPLALELCAAQIQLFTSAQLLAHLQGHSLDMLVDGALDLPFHQRTLRAAIQQSYELLNAEEQRFFRRLGVFVGGFDLAAVEEMGDSSQPAPSHQSSVPALRSLIAKSLVRAETTTTGEQRFSLLETIREFALEQVRLYNEEGVLCQRHYAIYLQRFRTIDHQLRGPDVTLWFARLQPDYDNFRTAIKWTLDSTHYEDAAWLLIATSWYCRLRGQWYEEVGWFQALLPHYHLLSPDLRLAFLLCFCSLARSPEDFKTISSYADDLVALTTVCSNKVLEAGVWHFLAKAAPDFAQAANAWEKSIPLAREAANLPGLGSEFGVASDQLFVLGGALDFYAARLIEQGAFAQAAPLIEEALAVSVERGFRSGIGASLSNLGLLALLQGNLREAYAHLSEALTITTTNSFPAVHAKTKTLLGLVTLYHNNPKAARLLLLESLDLWTNIRDTPYLAVVCIYLAETALWEQWPAEAEQWLAQAVSYRIQPVRLGSATWDAIFVAAHLAVERQEYRQAAMLLGLAGETRLRAHSTLVAPLRTQVNDALATVRAVLGPTVFAEAFAAGQQMTVEEAFNALEGADQAAM